MSGFTSILDHIAPALLVIFRIGGMMMYGPGFGSPTVPVRVRVFLAFLIGIASYPMLSAQHLVGFDIKFNLWMLVPLVAMEILVGLVIGYCASLPLLALETAGLIMGQQMGLGFARFYNPAMDDEADVLGQVLFFMALGGFLLIGGHEWMLMAVLHSFERIQLGGFIADQSVLDLVSGLILSSLELALRVAAPLLALVFLETVAMGFLAKTVPQLNVLSLGFPIRILLGLAVVALGLVVINDVAMISINEMSVSVMQWIDNTPTSAGVD